MKNKTAGNIGFAKYCAVRSSDMTIHKFTTLVLWYFEAETLVGFLASVYSLEMGQVERPDRT